MTDQEPPSEEEVRRWLTHVHQPDVLARTSLADVLRAQGRVAPGQTDYDTGRAAAAVLAEAIERLRPPDDGPRDDFVAYDVLQTCFLSGLKHETAARRLGISGRQLTRWRSRAVRLLADEVTRSPAPVAEAYQFTPIPAILDFQPRPVVSAQLAHGLDEHRVVHVHGSRGIGKTCLVAELALGRQHDVPVLWYRVRSGVNDSLSSVLFELAEHLRVRGRAVPAQAFAAPAGPADLGLLGRQVVRELAGLPLLLVLDDLHLVPPGSPIVGFVDDAVTRLRDLRVVTVGRRSDHPFGTGVSFDVPPMTRIETQRLLHHLGVRTSPVMADTIQRWTSGLPQLIRLAATWLRSATDEEVARGLAGLDEQDAVQSFLLGAVTELIESVDRAVLDAASVFRQHFNDEVLAHVAGLTVGSVRDTSRRLTRSHLATRSRGGDVAFFHGSIREHFYALLDPARRTELHRRAAQWYAAHGFDDEAAYHADAAVAAAPRAS